MRVVVDYDLCEGNGGCEAAAPEVFRLRPDGTLDVLVRRLDQRSWSNVEVAARACPKLAITLEDA